MKFVENKDFNRQINLIVSHMKNGVPNKFIAMIFDGKEINTKSRKNDWGVDDNMIWSEGDISEIRETYKLDDKISPDFFVEDKGVNRQINLIVSHIENGVPDKIIAMLFDGKEKNLKSGNMKWTSEDIRKIREIREKFTVKQEEKQEEKTDWFATVKDKASSLYKELEEGIDKEEQEKKDKKEKMKNIYNNELYIPDRDGVRRALSALLTQDSDTLKLFEEGSRTYLKIFGGDINNFINLNSNLIQASISFKSLETLERIDEKDSLILENLIKMNEKNDLIIKKLEDLDKKLSK